jgi:hypothetical protein
MLGTSSLVELSFLLLYPSATLRAGPDLTGIGIELVLAANWSLVHGRFLGLGYV